MKHVLHDSKKIQESSPWLIVNKTTPKISFTEGELHRAVYAVPPLHERFLILTSCCCWFIKQRKPQHPNTIPQHSQPGFPQFHTKCPPRHLSFTVSHFPPFSAPWISPCYNFSFLPSFLPALCQPEITLQEPAFWAASVYPFCSACPSGSSTPSSAPGLFIGTSATISINNRNLFHAAITRNGYTCFVQVPKVASGVGLKEKKVIWENPKNSISHGNITIIKGW